MEKNHKIMVLIIAIILLIISLFFLDKSLTGQAIKEDYQNNKNKSDFYMHTKAICNESNFCQDYEITCKNNETISIQPITGAVIQFDEDWQDPRTEDEREKLC